MTTSETIERDMFGGRRGEYPLPDDVYVAQCHSCNARIAWIKTKAGRAMPLSLATIETRDGVRYALSHFADCPEAKEWSRKR